MNVYTLCLINSKNVRKAYIILKQKPCYNKIKKICVKNGEKCILCV